MTDYKFEGWMGEDSSSAQGKMVWKGYEPKAWEETDVDIRVTTPGSADQTCILCDPAGQGATEYPCIVGHEIMGVAVRVGSKAENNIKIGDLVGVGPQSDACLGRDGRCNPCAAKHENYCSSFISTYNARHRNGDKAYGGHALYHRAPSHFVIKVPDGLAPELAAPMLCAGVSVYAPLKHFGAGPGKRVGIIGVGGLGHFAVLFAKALGVDEVVGISRKASKRSDAVSLGCDDYIATDDDADWAKKSSNRLDLIISTVSSEQAPFNDYVGLLRFDGTIVQLGMPETPISVASFALNFGRKRIAGSIIGSPSDIYDMFQLATEKKIQPWVETRPMDEANQALLDLEAGKARFRYVLVN